MAVFKRFNSRRVSAGEPNWCQAVWWCDFRHRGQRIQRALPGARTKTKAQKMEDQLRTTGDIRGIVRAANGSPVADAIVVLTSTERKGPKPVSVISNTCGEFNAPLLELGCWNLEVRTTGYKAFTREEVLVEIRRLTQVDLTLEPSADGFTEFVDQHYLPWARSNKESHRDDENRAQVLRREFGNQSLRSISNLQVEAFKASLLDHSTDRGMTYRGTPRSGATVNRYHSLLSSIFTLALKNKLVDFNPCSGIGKEDEGGNRERYLTREEQRDLVQKISNGKFSFVLPALIVAVNSGLRRAEMLRLKVNDLNFTDRVRFCRVKGNKDVILPPNNLLVRKTKNCEHRLIPMNAELRSTLAQLTADSTGDELVFSLVRNGVSDSTLRDGFKAACEATGITYGATVEGGIIWHDLRHTFGTRLREAGVHVLDIKQLLGHKTMAMVERYSHSTASNLEQAVTSLNRAEVVQFPAVRRAS